MSDKFIDQDYLRQVANALTGEKEQVKIVAGHCWQVDLKNNTLYFREDTPKSQKSEVLSLLLHEVGHIRYTDKRQVKEFSKLIETYPQVFDIYNALEDTRIEGKFMGDYPKTEELFDSLNTYYEDRLCAKIDSGEDKKIIKLHEYLIAIRTLIRRKKLPKRLSPDVRQVIDETYSAVKRAVTCDSTEELVKICDDEVFPILHKILNDKETPAPKDGQGRGGEGGGKTGKEDGEGESKDGEKKSEETQDGKGDAKGDTVKDSSKGGGAGEKRVGEDDLIEKTEGDVTGHGYGASGEGEKRVSNYMPDLKSYGDIKGKYQSLIVGFANRLKSVLVDNASVRYMGRYNSGLKLTGAKAYQSRLGKYDLFTRRREVNAKNYFVSLVVDESGSMSHIDGEDSQGVDIINAITAREATIFLMETLERLAIPFQVVGFNRYIETHKKFSDSLDARVKQRTEDLVKNAFGKNGGAGDNNDGDVLMKVAETSVDGEHIILMISDGSPAPGANAKYRELDEVVKTVSRRQNVRLIGIGVGGSGVVAVKRYYSHHAVVPNVAELPQVLVGVLSRLIARSI